MKKGRGWTSEDIKGYRQWIDNFISEYRDAGYAADCADLAIESLITYAELHKLHVEITTRVKPMKTISEVDFKNYRTFVRVARREVGAKNLADRQNTREIPLTEVSPGDLLIFNWMQSSQEPDIPYWHTAIFINENKLWFGNLEHRADGATEPQIPEYVSSDKPRNGNGPEFYLTHQDLYHRKPRRWLMFLKADK